MGQTGNAKYYAAVCEFIFLCTGVVFQFINLILVAYKAWKRGYSKELRKFQMNFEFLLHVFLAASMITYLFVFVGLSLRKLEVHMRGKTWTAEDVDRGVFVYINRTFKPANETMPNGEGSKDFSLLDTYRLFQDTAYLFGTLVLLLVAQIYFRSIRLINENTVEGDWMSFLGTVGLYTSYIVLNILSLTWKSLFWMRPISQLLGAIYSASFLSFMAAKYITALKMHASTELHLNRMDLMILESDSTTTEDSLATNREREKIREKKDVYDRFTRYTRLIQLGLRVASISSWLCVLTILGSTILDNYQNSELFFVVKTVLARLAYFPLPFIAAGSLMFMFNVPDLLIASKFAKSSTTASRHESSPSSFGPSIEWNLNGTISISSGSSFLSSFSRNNASKKSLNTSSDSGISIAMDANKPQSESIIHKLVPSLHRPSRMRDDSFQLRRRETPDSISLDVYTKVDPKRPAVRQTIGAPRRALHNINQSITSFTSHLSYFTNSPSVSSSSSSKDSPKVANPKAKKPLSESNNSSSESSSNTRDSVPPPVPTKDRVLRRPPIPADGITNPQIAELRKLAGSKSTPIMTVSLSDELLFARPKSSIVQAQVKPEETRGAKKLQSIFTNPSQSSTSVAAVSSSSSGKSSRAHDSTTKIDIPTSESLVQLHKVINVPPPIVADLDSLDI